MSMLRPSDFKLSAARAALRTGAIGLATAAAIFAAAPSYAQSPTATAVSTSTSMSAVPKGECGAFAKYMVEELHSFKDAMSRTFKISMGRYLGAGCKAYDDKGPIQIITETNQDAVSLDTALSRMDRFDIFATSGVAHCDRSVVIGNSCPTRTSSAVPAGPQIGG